MKKLLSVICLIGLLNNSLLADEFDDEFGEEISSMKSNSSDFDSEFKDIEVEPQKSYSLSFSGSLKVRPYFFLKDTDFDDKDNKRIHLDSILELNSKFKKGNYLLSGSVFAIDGTDYYNYKDTIFKEPRDLDKKVPIAGLREFYGIQSGDNYDLIIGKKIFKTGISTIYSPSDIYNITLSPDPLDPYTIGVWLGEFEYYTENSSYGIVFFPYISNSKTFNKKSRWSGSSNTKQNIDQFVIPQNTKIEKDEENKVRALFKFKTTQIILGRGVDFLLDVGYGPSLYTILEYTKDDNTYLETRPTAYYLSTGFSTTYKKLEVHGEVYYQRVEQRLDDDFISAVGGASYTLDKFVDKVGFDKINMTIEYVKEIVTRKFDDTKTYKSSKDERAPKNDILVKVDAQINYKWSLNYFGNFRLELEQNKDSGRYQKIGTTYSMNNGLTTEFFLELFNGDVNSYYGKWQDNDRIGLQFKYSF